MNRRILVLGACILVIAGIVAIAPGLHELNFKSAQSFAFAADPARRFVFPAVSIPADTPLWKILLFWLVLVVNLALLLLLLNPELRKRILRQVVRFATGVLLFLVLLRYRVMEWPLNDLAPPSIGQASPAVPGATAEVPSFIPPEPASWLTIAVGLLLWWVVLLAFFLLYRAWQQHRLRRTKTLDEVADIARASLADLASGRQWGDVVIEAYARMSEAVRRSRGLERAASATAREFADRLASIGLPASSVAELTRLFESVRYGGESPAASARSRASACLESILRACELPT